MRKKRILFSNLVRNLANRAAIYQIGLQMERALTQLNNTLWHLRIDNISEVEQKTTGGDI